MDGRYIKIDRSTIPENENGPVGAVCLHAHPKYFFVFSRNMIPVTQTQPKWGPKGPEELAQLCKIITSLSLGT